MNKTQGEILTLLEDRFKQVSSLKGDLSKFPVTKKDGLEFKTDKEKSRSFAEVFTPIHIVDEMIQTLPEGGLSMDTTNLDLCAGYGQFTIRMLRYLYTKHGKTFDIGKYLKNKHYYAELQISSCYKLLWIFSSKINLAIGDALQLGSLPKKATGTWYYHKGISSWINVTGIVNGLLKAVGYEKGNKYSAEKETFFVGLFTKFEEKLQEGVKMSVKQIISTKEGREKLLQIVNQTATGVEQNWQNNATPEWIVREMVNTIPGGVESVGKILVLFNVEFVECLIKEKGVDPKKVTFGYDSSLEGVYASAVYKVDTLSIGKNFSEMVEATKGCAGKFNVVISNPPYQVMDGGYGASAGPIYHEIVMYAIDTLQPQYVCMITPSRWMAGGKGLDSYRDRMLNDKHIRLIQDFPGTYDVFDNLGGISGGVSYFLWDRDYKGLCDFDGIQRDISEFDVLIRDNTAHQILKKVIAKHTGDFCNKKVLPRKPFGLPTNFKDWVPEGTPGAVKCYCPIKMGFEKWVSSEVLEDRHGVLAKWKVFTPSAGWGGNAYTGGPTPVISQIFVGGKMSACIETYIVTGAFSNKNEADNYAIYMRTKFYRFMLSLRVISQHINTQKFSWVPDMGDYSRTYSDADLYSHFGLSRKEIEHIDKTIK
jgi:hypothetical protein